MNKLSNYKELNYEAMSTDVLNNLGNPLDALSRLVEAVSPDTGVSAVYRRAQEQSRYCVLMFKVLFLQRYYGLGDHRYSIRLSTAPVFVTSFASVMCEMFPTRKPSGTEMLTRYDKLFNDPRQP
jgi:IS5 family transposase